MGFENSFNNPPPQKTPEEKPEIKREEEIEQDAFVDENGVEQHFSKEGLLNRNFGKNVEKPSEALFYNGGILNRPKLQEMARVQREQRHKEDAEKIQKIREDLGIAKIQTAEAGEQLFSPEGLLNRNFGKNKEQATVESETIPVQELTPAPEIESGQVENTESNREKPLLQQLVESHQEYSDDPLSSARRTLFEHFEPNLSMDEKRNLMASFNEEYRLYKEGKNWK